MSALPLQFLPTPDDYAGHYVQLASRANAAATTGVVVSTDGGFGVRGVPDELGSGRVARAEFLAGILEGQLDRLTLTESVLCPVERRLLRSEALLERRPTIDLSRLAKGRRDAEALAVRIAAQQTRRTAWRPGVDGQECDPLE